MDDGACEFISVRCDGGVARIVVNRPESLNALNPGVLSELKKAFESLCENRGIRAAVITGAGEKAFVAGADIACMKELDGGGIRSFIELGQDVMRRIEGAGFPVIAAVNGYALGGGLELALACDIIVASSGARFGVPEVALGIIPGFGGTQRLLHRCGSGRAKYLALTGNVIGAEEAYTLGIVDKLCEGDVLEEAVSLAREISKRGPLAVAAAKRVIGEAAREILDKGLDLEVNAFMSLFETEDRVEGMEAFMEKRKPRFLGK